MGNQEQKIQIQWQHWTHKTQEEDKQNTHTHKANTEHYRDEFEDTLLKQGVNTFAPEE